MAGRVSQLRDKFEVKASTQQDVSQFPQPGSPVSMDVDEEQTNIAKMDALVQQLEDFKQLLAQPKLPLEQCQKLLTDLRIALMQFPFKDPSKLQPGAVDKELVFTRVVLEQAVAFYTKAEDASTLERYIQQLKPYYFDYEPFCGPVSERKFPILGLYLLHLLAENRIAEFHTELELIPIEEQQKNPFIKYAVSLEQDLMEGRYNRIWSARKDVPIDGYKFIIDRLTVSLRRDIADCMEKSYESLSMGEAQKMLMYDGNNIDAFEDFIEVRGWETEMEEIKFTKQTEVQKTVCDNAIELIMQQLTYADELERII